MAWCLHRVCRTRLTTLLSLTRVLPQFSSKFDVDVMDEFTSQLIQKKIEKWDHQKRKNEALLETTTAKVGPKSGDNNAKEMSPNQLSCLFQNYLDNEDNDAVINLSKSCIESNKPPPVTTLFNVLSVCSQKGEKEVIQGLQKLTEWHYKEVALENSNFRDFLAEAVWVKGDILKALEMFEEVYRENAYLRRRIRLMLKYLIADLVTKGSEAAMGKMISFSERMLRDFQDFFPLACVWQNCFLSEWFTDQRIALDLLEKHNNLCRAVVNRIPYVVFVSLKCHRTEVVYRLLEILLKYKMKAQYSSVLGSLLEYQFRYGDWVTCKEIISWAVDHDVPLPQNYVIEKINLILSQKLNTPLASLERQPAPPTKSDFKF